MQKFERNHIQTDRLRLLFEDEEKPDYVCTAGGKCVPTTSCILVSMNPLFCCRLLADFCRVSFGYREVCDVIDLV